MIKLKMLLNEIKIKSTDRIIMSDDETINFKNAMQKVNYKPNGLWYGIGTSWINWVKISMPEQTRKYLFMMGTALELDNFDRKYNIAEKINWKVVSQKYSGIEINPYVWSRRNELFWYYGWDVASGCIWDKNAIKKITRIQ
jgi:hypothetical protein